jgi:hypothetical protein
MDQQPIVAAEPHGESPALDTLPVTLLLLEQHLLKRARATARRIEERVRRLLAAESSSRSSEEGRAARMEKPPGR